MTRIYGGCTIYLCDPPARTDREQQPARFWRDHHGDRSTNAGESSQCREVHRATDGRGKEKVSQNAVKHGLLAQTAVLQEQERQEYARYREEMLAELLPDADRLLGRMLLADFSGPRVLERLQLYERRIENALGRAQVE